MCPGLPAEVIGDLVELVSPPGGGAGQTPKSCYAGDAYGGPGRVGRLCSQIAVGELSARLVHHGRRQREHVPRRNGVVCIVEARRRRSRRKCPHSAGIPAGDVVDAVAQIEVIPGAEAMVHLGEEIDVVNRVGVETGCDGRTLVTDGSQTIVDCTHIGGLNCNQAALVQQPLFKAGEIEGAVANDWSTQASGVLGLGHG